MTHRRTRAKEVVRGVIITLSRPRVISIGRLGHTLLNEHEKLFGSYSVTGGMPSGLPVV
jgi:hypothetical protein